VVESEGSEGEDSAHTGRRPGRTRTRAQILESARQRFADLGYEQTTIRAVAEQAGVDPALVMHYFGSKEGLFQAAIDWPFDMDAAAAKIFEGDPDTVGERLVRQVCRVWEDEAMRHPLAAIVRNSLEREDVARLMSEFVAKEMVGRVVRRTGDPDSALRGALIHSALMGLAVSRYMVKIEPLASAPIEDVVREAGPVIQHYLSGATGA